MRTKLEKKYNKLRLKDEIENHQNPNKRAKEKTRNQKKMEQIEKYLYNKLELRTKLKKKFTKRSSKKFRNQNNKDRMGKKISN
jgi:hypothetical protein